MLWEFDEGWIETRDYIPIVAMKYIQQRRAREALRFLIIDWSRIRFKINTFNIGRLKWQIAQEIIEGLYEQIRWFLEINEEIVLRVIKMFLKGLRANDEIANRIALEYLPMTNVCVDHKGNIIHFPNEGAYEMQAIDKIRFLTLYRQAVLERLQEKR